VQKLSYQKTPAAQSHFENRKEELINTFAPRLTPQEKIGFETLCVSSKQNGARFSIFLRDLASIFV